MATFTEVLQLAVRQHRANNLLQAEQLYRKLLEQQPTHPDALHGLCMLAQQKGEYQQAQRLLNLILRVQPQSVKAWFSLGNVRQVQGQLPEAIQAYQQALALHPQLVPVYNNLGYTLQLQDRWEEAIACYQKALELQPNCTEADVNLANALHAQGKLPPEKQAHYAALNNDLGVTQKKAGDLKTAMAYYRQAIALQPDLAIAHYNLGTARQALGNLEEAIACYQKALSFNPADGEVYKKLAQNQLHRIYRLQNKLKHQDINKKLKVAFVCQPFVMTSFPNPLDSIGILTSEIVRLLAKDCEIAVYAPGETFQEVVHEGVRYRYIPINTDKLLLQHLEKLPGFKNPKKPLFASRWYYLGFILQVANDLRKQEFDVVHIHNLAQFVPVIKALNPQTKIVLHMHCEWLKQLDRKTLEGRLRHADLIISPSEYISQQVRQRFPQFAERCQTIYNGVNFERFLDTSVNHPHQNHQVKKLLFVGRVCPEKGSHILLEAFKKVRAQCPETQLQLVGPVGVIPYEYLVGVTDDPVVADLATFHRDDNWISYLKNTISELIGEGDREKGVNPVSLTSPLPPSQLIDYFRQADIFIFPSICQEAFGMPIAEAMVAGIPVVATQAGAFPELVEDGKTGVLVKRSDADALAEAILKLLADEQLRKSIGKAGCEKAVALFSFEKIADELLAKYERLCNREASATKLELSVISH
jgi:glycosyltransferase involved in cell wall biosynthesis/Flp pilus assembly protein TadD